MSQILTSLFYIATTIGAFQIISFESTEHTIAEIIKRLDGCLEIVERLSIIYNIQQNEMEIASKKSKDIMKILFPMLKRLYARIGRKKLPTKFNTIIFSSGVDDEDFDAGNNTWSQAKTITTRPKWKERTLTPYIGVENITESEKNERNIELQRKFYIPPNSQMVSAKLEACAVNKCEFTFNNNNPLSVEGYSEITTHNIQGYLSIGQNFVKMQVKYPEREETTGENVIGVSYRILVEFKT